MEDFCRGNHIRSRRSLYCSRLKSIMLHWTKQLFRLPLDVMMLKIENGCRFRKRIEKGFLEVFRLINDKKHNILYCCSQQNLVLFLTSVQSWSVEIYYVIYPKFGRGRQWKKRVVCQLHLFINLAYLFSSMSGINIITSTVADTKT